MGQIMMNGRGYSGAKIVELTQAEYDALPESKENDGIEYFIIDSDGDMPYVIANPTDSATTQLNKIYIDGVVYYIPQGSAVIPNPSGTPSTDLESLEIDGTVYGIPEGTEVIANPSGTATDELTKLGVDGTIYELGGGTEVIANPTGTPTDDLETISIDGDIFSVGGGNANEQVLTWAEYCALTPEEKTNGTTYYINDINGDGQSFQPVIFSFEEREIGVYGDGKPLYSRTFAKTIASSPDADSSSFLVASNIDYVDTLVNIWGSVCRPEGDAYAGSTGLIMAGGWQYSFHINPSHQLVVWTGDFSSYYRSIAGGNVVVTIQYTKTTDQPGSGTWTPQGVPAVHYDGNEKVVGTWFGETLYEKTYTVNLEVNNSNWTSTGIEVGDIDKAISVVAGNNVGTCWNALFCAVDQTYIRLTSPRNGDTISVNWFTLRYTKSTS